jgi:hypothetical protein
MVEINHKIVITGILSLTAIYIALLLTEHVDGTIGAMIVGIIGLSIGVVLPSPRIDHKRGYLIW